jgi:23S rRNA pseudouridine2605 synthase
MAGQERLQKILARAGLGSRRACEELIRQGRVSVNGQIANLGQRADPKRDRIAVDQQPVRSKQERTYIALYKPPGVVSTARDTRGRPTVVDLVESAARLYPVGRLDLDSAGLVLLTNDGELAQLLMHPRYEHSKTYQVRVAGRPREQTLRQWREGVMLDDRRTAPANVTVLRRERDGTWLELVLREGRKRQIRRVAELLGHPVQELVRVRIGPLHLGGLKPGEWRHLSAQEVAELERLKAQKRPARRKRNP